VSNPVSCGCGHGVAFVTAVVEAEADVEASDTDFASATRAAIAEVFGLGAEPIVTPDRAFEPCDEAAGVGADVDAGAGLNDAGIP